MSSPTQQAPEDGLEIGGNASSYEMYHLKEAETIQEITVIPQV
jgi:hypothetical protein